MAKGFGVTQQAISLYEQGRRELKLKTLKKIADFLMFLFLTYKDLLTIISVPVT
ncbi:helix-turn-helix transcriptional regulator [Klebsiella quasipneumoniae]|nr:helix-turn-helix transcriptional regulator [Klebsiella quasipneumoniae]